MSLLQPLTLCLSDADLGWDPELLTATQQLKGLIQSLAPGRLVSELHALMAYGAAAPSVQLLWRLGLLGPLLPVHARHLLACGCQPGCAFYSRLQRPAATHLAQRQLHMSCCLLAAVAAPGLVRSLTAG